MTAPVPVALTGLGCTSHSRFAEDYRAWWTARNRRRAAPATVPRLVWIPQQRLSLPAGDVYLIETVPVFLQVRAQLAATATVVVSDSPLLLSEIPGLQALDWQQDPWQFKLQPVNFAGLEAIRQRGLRERDNPWAGCEPASLDRLGLVIDETSTGTLLTPLNAVLNNLDHLARAKYRVALARYLNGELDLAQFAAAGQQVLRSATGGETALLQQGADATVAKLRAANGLYPKLIATLQAKRTVANLLKGTKITLYECRFLTNLVGSYTRTVRQNSGAAHPAK